MGEEGSPADTWTDIPWILGAAHVFLVLVSGSSWRQPSGRLERNR
ncbi:hypothetical protein [uncultured Friedmanniella sp.]